MSNEKKQSSVEWLIAELGEYFPHEIGGINLMVEKAKEMHREETKTAWNHGFDWGQMEQSLAEQGKPSTLIDSEHYYNETYGTR